jgi:hypothetical protein
MAVGDTLLSAVQEEKTLCQYTALGGHRLEFFGSAWSELMDISMASIWMIPTQAYSWGSFEGPNKTASAKWTQEWSECLW